MPLREAEDQDVLDGLLAEVVVDAVDLLLVGTTCRTLAVELARGGEVAAERLLDDDARAPTCSRLRDQARLAELPIVTSVKTLGGVAR